MGIEITDCGRAAEREWRAGSQATEWHDVIVGGEAEPPAVFSHHVGAVAIPLEALKDSWGMGKCC